MDDIEALKKAMREAQPSGRGNYIEEGRHELTLTKLEIKRSQIEGRIKESWIAEFRVDASSNPTHEVGSTRSYVDVPENQGAMGRWKACLAALCGCPSNVQLTPQWHEYLAEVHAMLRYDDYRKSKGVAENWLVGKRVSCEGSPSKSKGGTPITNKRWEPLAPQQAA